MLEKKQIQAILRGEVTKQEAAQALGVTRRSMDRYLHRFQEKGPEGLYDGRHSNYHRMDGRTERSIGQAKLEGPHRSSRWIRDGLNLSVHRDTVRRVLPGHHLERGALPPLKAIRSFEAQEPNDLWQIGLQGKVHFPLIGDLLLLLVTDDHSRFLLRRLGIERIYGKRPRTKGNSHSSSRISSWRTSITLP